MQLREIPPAPRILLVRLRLIGDVVFTTPAVAALRRQFPDAHLTYLVEPLAAPIVALNPHIDEVLIAPRRHVLADVLLGRSLRRRRYDVALDFHGGPRASLLTWLSRAPVRIGYDIPGRGWMYTTRVARPRGWRPRHAVQNQWDLLAALGVPPPEPGTSHVEMPPDPSAMSVIADRLERAGVRAADRLVVIHVSAGNPFRRWPRSAFASLSAGLASQDDSRRRDDDVDDQAQPNQKDSWRRRYFTQLHILQASTVASPMSITGMSSLIG